MSEATFTLPVPTWPAIVAAELELGHSVAVAFSRIAAGDFRFTDALAVTLAARAGAGQPVKRDEVADEIQKAGYLQLRMPVLRWLEVAIMGAEATKAA